jgi:hypothetical protein
VGSIHIYMAQGRVQWRALAYRVINFRVPKKAKSFSISHTTISFSWETKTNRHSYLVINCLRLIHKFYRMLNNPKSFRDILLGRKLGQYTSYTDWGFSWFYSVSSGRCRETNSLKTRSFSSKSFPNQQLSLVMGFDSIWSKYWQRLK